MPGNGNASGIYLKKIFKESLFSKCNDIRSTDILHSINGNQIDNYGEFSTKRWMMQKMTLENMLCTLKIGKPIELGYYSMEPTTKKQLKWNKKKKCKCDKNESDSENDSENDSDSDSDSDSDTREYSDTIQYTHCIMNPNYKLSIRTRYSVFEKIDFETIGGLVVMPLTLNHLNNHHHINTNICLLYSSDAADDLHCVELGGRRIIKKKKKKNQKNKNKQNHPH